MVWKDLPDSEGFWWLKAKDGLRTVACVSKVDSCGYCTFHLVGYSQAFTDRDIDEGSLKGMKWRKIPCRS